MIAIVGVTMAITAFKVVLLLTSFASLFAVSWIGLALLGY